MLDYRDPTFLPGGTKNLDLPGMIALGATNPLWLAVEGAQPETFGARFGELVPFTGDAAQVDASAIIWMLKE